jgi:Transposase
MSVYVGIDVHRKRSQVAVVAEDGTVQLNKNVVNGTETLLRLIGDLPPGTPVASGAASGWGWLARLLEDDGFEAHLVHPLRCKAIASARLKNDKGRRRDLGPAAPRGPAPRGAGSPGGGAPAPRCCGTGPGWSGWAPGSGTGSTRWRPISATTGPAATCPGRAAAGWPGRVLPAASREVLAGCLAVTGRAGSGDRPDRRRAARPRQGRPAGHGAPDIARSR